MRRRQTNTWIDTRQLVCPSCGQELPNPRLVLDTNRNSYRRGLGVGWNKYPCPSCPNYLVLRVEMTGSFFEKTGMGIVPELTLYRLPEEKENGDWGEEDLIVLDQWSLPVQETIVVGDE